MAVPAASEVDDLVPLRPSPKIEMIIGPKVINALNQDIQEDFSFSKRYLAAAAQVQQNRQGFLGRIRNLLSNNQPTSVDFREQTFRGFSYQSPMFRPLTEYKPYDILGPTVIDQMRRNGVIKTGLFLKKAPILAVIAKSSIKHENPRIQAYLNHVMEDILYPLVQSSLLAMDYGVALHEKVWEAESISFKYSDDKGVNRTFNGDSLHYKKIKWNNLSTIKEIRIQPGSQDYDGYVQNAGTTPIPIPAEKSFMFGKGQENTLWGTSDLDSVYEYWYWLELISGYHMRYLEKLGTPPMIGYAPNGITYSRDLEKSVENITWLAQLAGNLQDGGAIVMPSVFDTNSRNRLWELKEMAISDRGDLYGNATVWLEGAILKGLFVPDKPVSSGNTSIGSYALADVQFEAFLVGEEWDTQSLVRQIERYVLRPLLDVNFGPKVADATIQHPPLSRELKQRVFDIFKSLIANHPDYSAINFKEIADELGVPMYSDAEQQKRNQQKFEDAQKMADITRPQKQDQNPPPDQKANSQAQPINVIVNPITEISNLKEMQTAWSNETQQVIEAVKPKLLGGVRKIIKRDTNNRISEVIELPEDPNDSSSM